MRDGGAFAHVERFRRWRVVVGREAEVVDARRHDCVVFGSLHAWTARLTDVRDKVVAGEWDTVHGQTLRPTM
eukprot:3490777-Prymnesium_polylepis.2